MSAVGRVFTVPGAYLHDGNWQALWWGDFPQRAFILGEFVTAALALIHCLILSGVTNSVT